MSTSFADRVLEVVRLIPKGRVTSYGCIGKYLGANKSARLVGTIMKHSAAQNVPAHRVVNSVGLLTGQHAFSSDYPMQQRLKEEGIKIKNDKVLNFKKVFWDPNLEL